MAAMSEHIHIGRLRDQGALEEALNAFCEDSAGQFVRNLAATTDRWSTVSQLLSSSQQAILINLAYSPRWSTGFSVGNLKAHYVLDEDFVDGGTAFIVFALVGSTWTHVVRVTGQAALVPLESWQVGQTR
jgi:hypothetical protein